jgi:hypothetical protein
MLPASEQRTHQPSAATTPGAWRIVLTAREQQVARTIMVERLAQYGYETEPDPVQRSG